ncbi:hypothetical protein NP493_1443g00002 [Ridgeia piscesae]|uniref:Uncharacterized protein n=1 Tax=Ridgeia piscesae TaxID=27915 RepID=A0AAD9NCN9_RIDPI|nr:hypothetical protein NP493_1443g00002 [Ridgeia piscesae]
MIHSLTHPTIH